jgi:hypothetical protein
MAYHHVVSKIGPGDKFRVLFSDLSLEELKRRFIAAYERGTSFFSGNDLISPSDLRSVQIIKTARTEQEERESINKASLARIDEINRSSGIMFISGGSGYDPEDIAEAGEDVTHSLIKGPPGFKKGKWSKPVRALAWVAGIVATIIAAGIIKWLGLK